jgi:lipopolysaccharide export LptBFGC system permease protein LptF
MFIQVGVASSLTAAWIPNVLFIVVAVALYAKAPK